MMNRGKAHGKTQTANYKKLPAEKYKFKVVASNSYGMANDPATIGFTILAPLFNRPWFISLAIIFIILGIVLIIIRNLVKEKKILAEKVSERTLELSLANDELAERNKDITDRIQYASRIRFVILPAEIPFKESFIFFKPKHIVSVDFCWDNIHNKKSIWQLLIVQAMVFQWHLCRLLYIHR